MFVSRVILKNWRNFTHTDVQLGQKVFLLGPNACGKSNFMDLFHFLRDMVKPGGGLQSAVQRRGGLSKIRCLAARQSPDVEIEVHLSDSLSQKLLWQYAIGLRQQNHGYHRLYLTYEKVRKGDKLLLNRPDKEDKKDDLRLTETHLERVSANREFRDISDFFESVSYPMPQYIRHPDFFSGIPEDQFGQGLMERIEKTFMNIRRSRFKKINEVLMTAIPQLREMTYITDNIGGPHLEAAYHHWYLIADKQREDMFSDGMLRLLGVLWALLERDSILLLEKPELGLNSGIVRQLSELIRRLERTQKIKRQLIISTHSYELLTDKKIRGNEVLLMTPGNDGTEVCVASDKEEIRDLLKGGMSIAEAVLPLTDPPNISQLGMLFTDPAKSD